MCELSIKDIEDALDEIVKDNHPFIETINDNLYRVDKSLICDKNTLIKILQ